MTTPAEKQHLKTPQGALPEEAEAVARGKRPPKADSSTLLQIKTTTSNKASLTFVKKQLEVAKVAILSEKQHLKTPQSVLPEMPEALPAERKHPPRADSSTSLLSTHLSLSERNVPL